MAPEARVTEDAVVDLAGGELQASDGGVCDEVRHVESQARPEVDVAHPAGVREPLEVGGVSTEECDMELVHCLRDGRLRDGGLRDGGQLALA